MFIVEAIRVGIEVFARGDCFDLISLAPDPAGVFSSLFSLHSPTGEVMANAMNAAGRNCVQTQIITNKRAKTAWVQFDIKTCEAFIPLIEICPTTDIEDAALRLAASMEDPAITTRSFTVRPVGQSKYIGIPLKKGNAIVFLNKLTGLIANFEMIMKTGMIASKKETLTVQLEDSKGNKLFVQGFEDASSLLEDPDIGYHEEILAQGIERT